MHNKLADFVESWANGMPKEESDYQVIYGRRFIIETADQILKNYTEARKDNQSAVVLDKLLDEFIIAKFHNNPKLLAINQKKRLVEPYVHLQVKEVSDLFGSEESFKKILFVKFWQNADKTKTVEQLSVEFKQFVIDNSIEPSNKPSENKEVVSIMSDPLMDVVQKKNAFITIFGYSEEDAQKLIEIEEA